MATIDPPKTKKFPPEGVEVVEAPKNRIIPLEIANIIIDKYDSTLNILDESNQVLLIAYMMKLNIFKSRFMAKHLMVKEQLNIKTETDMKGSLIMACSMVERLSFITLS
jgi:hypothetical protein